MKMHRRKEDIEHLEALLADVEEGPEAALAKLSDKDDPASIRTRLVILLENNRFQDAVELITGRGLDDEWCEYGPATLVLADQEASAQQMYDAIRAALGPDKEPLRLRTTLAFARAVMGNTFKARTDPSITIGSLNNAEKTGLNKCLAILDDTINSIKRNAVVHSMLEANLVVTAKDASMLLENVEQARELATLLATHKPILLQVARDVRATLITPPEGICERLRTDHPDNIEALSLAVHIQGQFLEEYTPAIRAALQLEKRATLNKEKAYLAELMSHIPAPPELQGRVSEAVHRLLAHDPDALVLLEIEQMLKEKRPEKALLRLESVRNEDNSQWLQLYARALKDQGRKEDAARYFAIASEKMPHPDLFRMTAEAAYQAERFSDTIKALENALRLDPDDTTSLHNLSVLYAQQKHYSKAVECLQKLRKSNPDDENNLLNLAFSLREIGKTDESLEIYNELSDGGKPSLQAVIGRAHLLEGIGNPTKAFDSLQENRDRFWEDVSFVTYYWKLASEANHDDLAHEAFLQMNSFKEKGLVSDEAFRMVSFDEIKRMMKENAEQFQKRREAIHAEMLRGRMPWLWAEEMSHNTSYWGWRIRTHKYDWICDDPINRANYCIYATNSFHSRILEGMMREVLPIECPPKGTKVVADLSGLITLHRLGLLNETFAYFGKVIAPAAYLSRALQETPELTPHQLSQRSHAEMIEAKIRSRNINLVESLDKAKADGMFHVNEHDLDEQPGQYYNLKDVLQPLHDKGKISQQAFDEASRVAHKLSVVDAEHPAIGIGQSILFDLSTLETLASCNLLDVLVTCFSVGVLKEAEEEIVSRLNAFNFQEEVQKWHIDLWNILREDSRVSFVPHKAPEGINKGVKAGDDIGLAATYLAQMEKLPLLADDRVCQAFNLNENRDVPYAAFGTDVIINTLASEGLIDSTKQAGCFLQLMSWRYRFLLPPASVLVELAKQYSTNPPGQSLRDIARYLHDCMRDSGLFSGLEQTDPPVSIAMRYLLSWQGVIADCLMDVWCDLDIPKEKLKELTHWMITELLPSPPRSINGLQKVRIFDMSDRYLISQAMIRSIQKSDTERAGDCLEAMRVSMKLNQKDYLKYVTGVLNAV